MHHDNMAQCITTIWRNAKHKNIDRVHCDRCLVRSFGIQRY
ncbi:MULTISPECIES: hypothetical protein [unclassified Moorena]|nr:MULTISPECIES: hypothetical protein [unclassified Moorena]